MLGKRSVLGPMLDSLDHLLRGIRPCFHLPRGQRAHRFRNAACYVIRDVIGCYVSRRYVSRYVLRYVSPPFPVRSLPVCAALELLFPRHHRSPVRPFAPPKNVGLGVRGVGRAPPGVRPPRPGDGRRAGLEAGISRLAAVTLHNYPYRAKPSPSRSRNRPLARSHEVYDPAERFSGQDDRPHEEPDGEVRDRTVAPHSGYIITGLSD